MTTVAISHNDRVEQAVDDALALVNVEPLVANKTVAVKPNDTWASRSDTTAVTQPDTLQAVIRYLKNLQPAKIVVSGGAGAGETDEIFKIAGLMDVVQKEEVEFFDHNRSPFKEVQLKYDPQNGVSGPQKSVMVNPRILEYDTIISLAQLKVHETATVTLSLKNIAMSYPAADYYGHPRSRQKHDNAFFADMHSFIAAMAKTFPIDLSIIVGHPAMIGQGPIGGKTFETGLVVASTDPLAADVVGARLLGFDPEAVRQLKEAHLLGVGETNTDEFDFPGLKLEEAIAIFTKAAYGSPLDIEHA